MNKLVTVLTIFLSLLSSTVLADTHTAASCENKAGQLDVQAAIDASASGDTVSVPAGSCTWTTYVSIPDAKKIIFQGAGIGTTNITFAHGERMLDLNKSGSRVTGFTFNEGVIYADGQGWRVDTCRFYSAGGGYGGNTAGIGVLQKTTVGNANPPWGLIDACAFVNMRVIAYGADPAGNFANQRFSEAMDLGGGESAIYVENVTFDVSAGITANSLDSNYGGAYVLRYSDLNNDEIMAHGLQATNTRGTKRWEIYRNKITQDGVTTFAPLYLRGGTGVVFGNVITGTYTISGLYIDNQRSTGDWTGVGDHPMHGCDGSSPWDGNTGTAGYPCRDQIGRGIDNPKWVGTDGSEGEYTQASDPAYFWNNTFNGSALSVVIKSGSETHLVSERDFYNTASTAKPGYTAFSCPYPIDANGFPDPDGAVVGSCGDGAGTTFYTRSGETIYTVTATGTNVTVSPASQGTTGAALEITVTGIYGYTPSCSGCGGSLSGTTYTTGGTHSADCTVTCTGIKHMAEGIGTGSGSMTGIGTGSGVATIGD